MSDTQNNIAVILAGGTGRRMGGTIPKQFMSLGDSTIIEECIERFEQCPTIDRVAVVMHPDHIEQMRRIAQRHLWFKYDGIITGGDERYLSSFNAIKHCMYILSAEGLNLTQTNIILHDAARPWVSQEILKKVTDALLQHDAVAVGIHTTDTIWQTANGTTITAIPPRHLLWQAQTPQAFRLPLINEAYQKALSDPTFTATDDCGVLLRYMPEKHIYIVEGSPENRKVTFPNDL